MLAPSHRIPAAVLLTILLLSIFIFKDNPLIQSGRVLLPNRPTHDEQQQQSSSPASIGEELAYITFFTGTQANKSDPDISKDVYFTATRILGYQLMHAPTTRTRRAIPFVVLVPPDVVPAKRERFEKDGAVVIEVPYLELPEWVIPAEARWKDVMSKLRAWQQTQFSRCLLLDGDMILNAPLDGVFDDDAAARFTSTRRASLMNDDDSGDNDTDSSPLLLLLPDQYLFASIPEATAHHTQIGEFSDINYFNAGFFLFGPSIPVFNYYTSKLQEQGTWDPKYPEQNLLNYIHSQSGRMPWTRLDTKWNVKFPTVRDKEEEGVVSMHDKFWRADVDAGLQDYYNSLRWKMEGFYEGLDVGRKSGWRG